MNQDNYCSLEVAQRLVDAGIVLETECFYDLKSELHLNRGMTGKRLVREGCLPAPCFAELWKELPLGSICVKHKVTGVNSCWSPDSSYIENTNPADALAELLIWVKGQEAL